MDCPYSSSGAGESSAVPSRPNHLAEGSGAAQLLLTDPERAPGAAQIPKTWQKSG
jgi:hypothetical protein